ncbi:TPA: hypothetical protein UM350_000481 [Stenotrophomonas maltophilia]|nr:hypothetical protein [Stenotrophomonas maltophilia]
MKQQQGIALRKLRDAWDNASGFFQELGGVIYPGSATSIFVEDSSRQPTTGTIPFKIKPIVFDVPERAKYRNERIFIVAKGRISVCAADTKTIRTKDFSTEVAYFRRQDDADKNVMKLDHVFGAHFDYAPSHKGHPIFHAQMNDLDALKSAVAEAHRVPTDDGSNYMSCILRNVRLPTAQMDILSLMLQLAADHLIYEKSQPDQMKALKDLAAQIRMLKSAADLVQPLTAEQCTRAVHWY